MGGGGGVGVKVLGFWGMGLGSRALAFRVECEVAAKHL